MQAVVFNLQEKSLGVVKKDIPRIENGDQILVKVAYAGVCGTDLHIIQGEFPIKKDGVTLGHEFSGVIVDVGTSVKSFKIGDHVVVDPNSGCQVCDFCHSGEPHFCATALSTVITGLFKDGGWAEYCLVPQSQVMKIPSNITLEQAALCEPLSCLAHGWDKISPIPVGKNILITGAGIIGNLWVICLHLQGHRRVTISEPNPHRRSQLAKLNTGYDAITPDQLKERQEKGILYDLIIDCSGFGPAIENALSLLNYGGKLCIFGVAPPHVKINISPYEIYLKELTIVSIKINPFTFPKALGLLEALGERYLNYDNLGIKTFELSEYEEALDCLKKGTIAKAMFKI
ncbi:sorbitol dehydrogenase [Holotrichia oblita]|uniref:Sorbitol dehydrogenase n=1 Tax=Holotrichia oblita TaxID=644536 RepID=A0ACB9SID4_HOLOL|nr:sorbitol dehydrogenase [Holotrichia oblita]